MCSKEKSNESGATHRLVLRCSSPQVGGGVGHLTAPRPSPAPQGAGRGPQQEEGKYEEGNGKKRSSEENSRAGRWKIEWRPRRLIRD